MSKPKDIQIVIMSTGAKQSNLKTLNNIIIFVCLITLTELKKTLLLFHKRIKTI